MASITKQELQDKLMLFHFENVALREENEHLRTTLHMIYSQSRIVLGIEAAAEERERQRQQKCNCGESYTCAMHSATENGVHD